MKLKNVFVWVITGGLFLVPFIPFIVPAGMYFPFISGKGFTFRILVEVLFGLYTILAFMAPEYRPKMSWITKAVGVFIVSIFIADLLSANPYKSFWSNYERMEGFVLIAHLALYYIVASGVMQTASRWFQWINVTLGASVIMTIYGILQIAGKITINQGGVRLDGTFGNASYFAIYLVFHIFLALYMLSRNYKVAWMKWAYGIIAVGEIYILYFTATRGAILGLVGGLTLSAIIIAFKERESKTLKKTAYGVLIAMLVLGAGFFALRNTSFVKTSPVLSRFSTLSASEFKTQGRYFVWPMAIKGVLERPFFGWGQESFNFVFNKNYDPRMYGQEQWFDRTHNIVLDWMVAGGIIGFLSYASMYVALLYYILRKKSNLSVIEKSLLVGMISAYIFHNMFVFDNLVSYIIFFSLLAFVHALNTADSKLEGSFYTKKFSSDGINYAVIPIVLIISIASIYFVNIPALNANTTLISSMVNSQNGGVEQNLKLFKKTFDYNSFGSNEALEQLTMFSSNIAYSQVAETLKKDFYDLTKKQIEKKIENTPKDARYLAFAGSFFNRFGQYYGSIGQNNLSLEQYDIAIKYLERAIIESPQKQSMYFELGTSYVSKKDYSKAFELFKKAYDLEPTSPESKIIYLVGAIYTKNNDIVNFIRPKIDNNIFISDNRIIRAYADVGDFQNVVDILKIRIKNDPNNQENKLTLASTYYQIGQKQLAVDLINEVIKANPSFKEQGEGYIRQILGQ